MRNAHDFNKFLICTDSLSIIKANNGFPKNKNPSYIILDIIEEINKLRVGGKEIEILWISSHAGITENRWYSTLIWSNTQWNSINHQEENL